MLIGVKFCGGCNSRYNRTDEYKKIAKYFQSDSAKEKVQFEFAETEVDYDALIVFGGCLNNCASVNAYQTKSQPIIVSDDKSANIAIATIEKIQKEKTDELETSV